MGTIKHKKFYTAKETINKMKRQHTEGVNIKNKELIELNVKKQKTPLKTVEG